MYIYMMTCSDCVADIDECTLGTHDCGPQFTCTNTAGSFRCHPKETCSTGFVQDAAGSCMGQSGLFFIDYKSEEFCSFLRLFSLDINECVANDSPCHAGHTCINTRGSYICRRNIVYCGRGYHLRENGTHCEGQCWSKRVEIFGVLCLRCPSSSHSCLRH